MTKSQFMYDLMIGLDGVPDEEKLLVMNDYDLYFSEKISDGMSEEAIVSSLKSPEEIAKGYKTGQPVPIEGVESVLSDLGKGKKTPLSVFKFILLIPVCALYEIFALSLGIVSLIVSLGLCFSGALLSVAAFMSSPLSRWFIVIGIGSIVITFAFVMLVTAVFQGTVRLVRKFPRFMSRILHNCEKERKTT